MRSKDKQPVGISGATKFAKPEFHRRSDEQQVNRAVKAWLENVLVPAMVRSTWSPNQRRSRRKNSRISRVGVGSFSQ